MGYTNYWTFSNMNKVPAGEVANMKLAAIAFIKFAMENQGYELADGFGDDDTAPTLGSEIVFNGLTSRAYETFYIPETIKDDFNFTKTAGLPYDAVVVGCMLCMKTYLSDHVKLSSDGVCYHSGTLDITDEIFAGIELWYNYLSQVLTYSKHEFFMQALMLFDELKNGVTGSVMAILVDKYIYR